MSRPGHGEQRHRQSRRIVPPAIGDAEAQPAQRDPVILAVRRPARREGNCRHFDPDQGRGRESASYRVRVEPRRADHLKREAGAAAHRQVGALEQAHPRVMQCALQVRHVGRRLHPWKPRLVEQHETLPPRRRDDHEVRADAEHIVRHPRQLAQRHPVPHRNGHEADERGVGIPRAGPRVPLHLFPADRVGAVEHDHALPRAGGVAHHLGRGRDVGVVPGPDVLQIDEHDVHRIERRAGGGARSAVKAVDWETAGGVHGVGEPRAVLGPAEPVLGAEQGRQPQAVGDQHIRVAAALAVDARMIGQQAEAFSPHEVYGIGEQDLDAGPHLRRRRRGTCE